MYKYNAVHQKSQRILDALSMRFRV